jgi:hypothetical protein
MKLFIMQYFSVFCYFLPLRSKYVSQRPFLEISVVVHTKQWKNLVSFTLILTFFTQQSGTQTILN